MLKKGTFLSTLNINRVHVFLFCVISAIVTGFLWLFHVRNTKSSTSEMRIFLSSGIFQMNWLEV
jgi:hypothetical protein